MNVSYNWLKEYVDFDLTPHELARELTLLGVKIETTRKVNAGAEGLVIGRVSGILRHPAAARLRVATVEIGGGRTLTIVTGADNVDATNVVPVAPPGSRLPGGRLLETAQVRGQLSEGMLCSLTEMLTGSGHAEGEGVLILPDDAPVGEDAATYLGLNDHVLELDLTPNYASHCLSMLGVAREVAALTGGEARLPAVPLRIGRPSAPEIAGLTSVEIADVERCPRYAAMMLTGVRVGPSPLWLQMRLLVLGIRPHNNVVDVTNLVMLETGQPLHAFDYDRLAGYRIIVRRAREGERLVTLDGKDRALAPDTLVIADAEKPVGIAGVMGGQNTEVSGSTRTIVLESAFFAGLGIRRIAARLALHTDASARFSKGLDPNGNAWACRRAIALMEAIGAGTPVEGIINAGRPEFPPRTAGLRLSRLNSLLGTRLTMEQVSGYLGRLGLEVRQVDQGLLEVTIPPRRPDLDEEIDLVEEVARLHGYNRIPVTLPKGKVTAARRNREERLTLAIKSLLAGAGYHEALTYSWNHPDALSRLGFGADAPERRQIAIMNPMAEDQRLLRTTLLPGMVAAVGYNVARRVKDVRLFEIARVFIPKALPLTELPDEPLRLGIAAVGETRPKAWGSAAEVADFFALSGVVAAVLRAMGLDGWRLEAASHPSLHPGRSARVVLADGEDAGYLGEMHPVVAERHGLTDRTFVAELDFGALLARSRPQVRFEPVPRHPSSSRDLAFVVGKDVPQDRLASTMRTAGGELLADLRLFDLYEGAPAVRAGYRSLAYTLVYRAPDRTLTEDEVSAAHDRVRQAVAREYGAELRS
jgi:phenylalanyl-tRNA synthetase beta chain